MSAALVLSLLVAALVFAAMASDRVAPHRAALAGAAVLLLSGALDGPGLMGVIGSPGLIIITGMMLVAAALEHTGLIDRFVRRLKAQVGRQPRRAWVHLYAGVLLGSAVLANTPMVVLAAPAVVALARQSGISVKPVLLPIVFLASLGGCLSLVGSSVNLIASESLLQAGLGGFGLFEFSLLGLLCAAGGVAFLALFGPRLMPVGDAPSAQLYEPDRLMLGEHAIAVGDPLVGTAALEFLQRHAGVSILDCRRDADTQSAADEPGRISLIADLRLRAGDRLLLEAPARWWIEQADLRQVDRAAAPIDVEVWVPPQSRWLGLPLAGLRLDRIHGVEVLGLASAQGRAHWAKHRVQIGDRLLLRGARTELERLLASEAALGPLQVERAGHATHRQWVAWLALGAAALPAIGWLSLPQAAVLAALIVMLGGAISRSQPLNRPSLRTLGLVFGMLAIGEALVGSGAVGLLADALEGSAGQVEPWLLLGLTLLIATLATEVLTNGAAVALLAPVVIPLCLHLGLDPRPFVVAVLFGASASFASPLAYQTNTYVHQIGGYRFADFLRVGVPLKLIVCLLCWYAIPRMWPLQAAA